jgi:Holliday junction resolvase
MSGHYERQLAQILDEQGYHILRAPASGSATTRELPDLLWGKEGHTPVAAELKTRGQEVAYLDKDEVESLQNFAAAFGAHARIVFRIKGDTNFYVIDPKDAHPTDKSLRVDKTMHSYTINE